MAVQKNRKTPSKRGMRRSHDSLSAPTLSEEAATGETHRRHHVSPEGFYRGRQVIEVAPEIEEEEDEVQG
ncbi:MAG: 50S ribosomal protein L32 [Wenzhouxiangella sp.]|nr:MAG: 50S ribosomal protein L32 [Wenzhouxiangella sp.]